MALLNIPSVAKGTPATVTLDKTLLMILLSETSDPYYANANNIKTAIAQYRSTDGNQTKNMEFDLSQVTPSSIFYTSTSAKNIFELQKIIVTDFDGGFIQIPKTSLPSGLNIDLSTPSGGAPVVWNTFLNGHTVEPDGGIYGPISGGNPNAFVYASGNPIPANTNGEFTFVLNNLSGTPKDFCFGIGPASGSNGSSTYFGMGLDSSISNVIRELRNNSLDVNPQISGVNLSGQTIVRIAREGLFYKLYVDNVLKVNISIATLSHNVNDILVPAVRTKGNAINTGIISSSRSI